MAGPDLGRMSASQIEQYLIDELTAGRTVEYTGGGSVAPSDIIELVTAPRGWSQSTESALSDAGYNPTELNILSGSYAGPSSIDEFLEMGLGEAGGIDSQLGDMTRFQLGAPDERAKQARARVMERIAAGEPALDYDGAPRNVSVRRDATGGGGGSDIEDFFSSPEPDRQVGPEDLSTSGLGGGSSRDSAPGSVLPGDVSPVQPGTIETEETGEEREGFWSQAKSIVTGERLFDGIYDFIDRTLVGRDERAAEQDLRETYDPEPVQTAGLSPAEAGPANRGAPSPPMTRLEAMLEQQAQVRADEAGQEGAATLSELLEDAITDEDGNRTDLDPDTLPTLLNFIDRMQRAQDGGTPFLPQGEELDRFAENLDLTQGQVDSLARSQELTERLGLDEEREPGALVQSLEQLGRGLYGIAGAASGYTDRVERTEEERDMGVLELAGSRAIEGFKNERQFTSRDVTGVTDTSDMQWLARAGWAVSHFAMDVGADPVSYVTLGGAGMSRRTISEAVERSVLRAADDVGRSDLLALSREGQERVLRGLGDDPVFNERVARAVREDVVGPVSPVNARRATQGGSQVDAAVVDDVLTDLSMSRLDVLEALEELGASPELRRVMLDQGLRAQAGGSFARGGATAMRRQLAGIFGDDAVYRSMDKSLQGGMQFTVPFVSRQADFGRRAVTLKPRSETLGKAAQASADLYNAMRRQMAGRAPGQGFQHLFAGRNRNEVKQLSRMLRHGNEEASGAAWAQYAAMRDAKIISGEAARASSARARGVHYTASNHLLGANDPDAAKEALRTVWAAKSGLVDETSGLNDLGERVVRGLGDMDPVDVTAGRAAFEELDELVRQVGRDAQELTGDAGEAMNLLNNYAPRRLMEMTEELSSAPGSAGVRAKAEHSRARSGFGAVFGVDETTGDWTVQSWLSAPEVGEDAARGGRQVLFEDDPTEAIVGYLESMDRFLGEQHVLRHLRVRGFQTDPNVLRWVEGSPDSASVEGALQPASQAARRARERTEAARSAAAGGKQERADELLGDLPDIIGREQADELYEAVEGFRVGFRQADAPAPAIAPLSKEQERLLRAARDSGASEAHLTIHRAARGWDEEASVADALGLDTVRQADIEAASRELARQADERLAARGLPEELVVWRSGGVPSDDVVNVSLSRGTAGFFGEPVEYRVRRADVLTDTDSAVPGGTFAESELQVAAGDLRPAPAAARQADAPPAAAAAKQLRETYPAARVRVRKISIAQDVSLDDGTLEALAALPPLPAGSRRLYRAAAPGEAVEPGEAASLAGRGGSVPGAGGRWYTDDPRVAEFYRRRASADRELVYVDVPEGRLLDAEDMAASGSEIPAREWLIGADDAARARPIASAAADVAEAATPAPGKWTVTRNGTTREFDDWTDAVAYGEREVASDLWDSTSEAILSRIGRDEELLNSMTDPRVLMRMNAEQAEEYIRHATEIIGRYVDPNINAAGVRKQLYGADPVATRYARKLTDLGWDREDAFRTDWQLMRQGKNPEALNEQALLAATEEGLFRPSAHAESLSRIGATQRSSSDEYSRMFVDKIWQPYYTTFKALATVGRGPGFSIRNALGGAHNAYISGARTSHFRNTERMIRLEHAAKRKVVKRLQDMDEVVPWSDVEGMIKDEVRTSFRKAFATKSRPDRGDRFFDALEQFYNRNLMTGSRTDEFTQQTLMQRDEARSVSRYAGGPGAASIGEVDLSGPRWARVLEGTGFGKRPTRAAQVDEMDAALARGAGASNTVFLGKQRGELNKLESAVQLLSDNPWVRANASLAELSEKYTRLSPFLAGLDRFGIEDGGRAAGLLVKASQFDYTDLTPFERRAMRNLMPFYTFSRFNIPFQVRGLVMEPHAYAKLGHGWEAAQDALGIDERWREEVFPRWVRDNMGVATGFAPADVPGADMLSRVPVLGGMFESQHPIALNLSSLPAMDLNKLFEVGGTFGVFSDTARDELISMTNPLPKTALEGILDVDTFTRGQLPETEDLPGWFQGRGNPLGAAADLVPGIERDGSGELSGPGWLTRVPRQIIPPVGQAERLTGSSDRYRDRMLTSWLSNMAGAPVSTLDAPQLRANATREQQRLLDQIAGWRGTEVSNDDLRLLVESDVPIEVIEEAHSLSRLPELVDLVAEAVG